MKLTLNEQAKNRLLDAGFYPIDKFWGKVSTRNTSNCYRIMFNWKYEFNKVGLTIFNEDFKFEGGTKNPYGTQCMYVGVPSRTAEAYRILTGVRREVE